MYPVPRSQCSASYCLLVQLPGTPVLRHGVTETATVDRPLDIILFLQDRVGVASNKTTPIQLSPANILNMYHGVHPLPYCGVHSCVEWEGAPTSGHYFCEP